ncbi:hypothetical protein NEUTE2DRAFT_66751 [Neurospora tetrasperma FGSC 2509]|nr:hypothetical protein NEUTE2DRAFT_66751 [Neurospora tetrasperma FGSC 2509]
MRIEEKIRADERSAMERERKVMLNGGGDGGYYEVSLSVMEMLGNLPRTSMEGWRGWYCHFERAMLNLDG